MGDPILRAGPRTKPELGLVLATVPGNGVGIGRVAAEAEAAGAASLWLTDHLFWHTPTVDCLTALAVVAASTSACTIGPCVLQLPLRDTASVAKATAYIDHLAGGRLVVGVGVGEHRGEYEQGGLGDRYHDRGARLDRGIGELRSHWSATGPYAMAPARTLPIWVGGRSPRARRRAAELGDGWVPHLCTVEWFAEQQARLDADLDRLGRDRSSVRRVAVVALAAEDAPGFDDPAGWLGRLYGLEPVAFERRLVTGASSEVAAAVRRFAQAGADEVLAFVASDDPVAQFAAVRGELDRVVR